LKIKSTFFLGHIFTKKGLSIIIGYI